MHVVGVLHARSKTVVFVKAAAAGAVLRGFVLDVRRVQRSIEELVQERHHVGRRRLVGLQAELQETQMRRVLFGEAPVDGSAAKPEVVPVDRRLEALLRRSECGLDGAPREHFDIEGPAKPRRGGALEVRDAVLARVHGTHARLEQ